jgi:hypothetical protein
MKKFTNPEIAVELLVLDDVITSSVDDGSGSDGAGGEYETPSRPIG